jgi:hypothetical protein
MAVMVEIEVMIVAVIEVMIVGVIEVMAQIVIAEINFPEYVGFLDCIHQEY